MSKGLGQDKQEKKDKKPKKRKKSKKGDGSRPLLLGVGF